MKAYCVVSIANKKQETWWHLKCSKVAAFLKQALRDTTQQKPQSHVQLFVFFMFPSEYVRRLVNE